MNRAAIFQAYLSAASAHDLETFLSFLTEDCDVTFQPKSAGLPPLRKAEFPNTLDATLNLWFAPEALKYTVIEVYEAHGDTIIARVESNGTSRLGTPWHNEYIFIVKFKAEDNKIAKIIEFGDSAFLKGFLEAERNAAEAMKV